MNLQIKTRSHNSLDDICENAKKLFISYIDNSTKNIIVPGGETPKLFFRLLANHDIDWCNISLILSDERMVPFSDSNSNYGMINDVLLSRLSTNNRPTIIPNMKEFDSYNYDDFLSYTNSLIKDHFPIDYAFLGVGSDGHIASLFNESLNQINSDEPYYYIKRKNDSYKRMTLSMHFLKRISNINFLISGTSKQEALNEIFNFNNKAIKSPFHKLIENSKGKINILADRLALKDSVND